jgi:hypothetical protein
MDKKRYLIKINKHIAKKTEIILFHFDISLIYELKCYLKIKRDFLKYCNNLK